VDTAAIKARIGAAQETNAAAAAVEERRRKSEELAVLEDDAANMTKHLQELEAKRAALLSNCWMPVPGIGFDTDGVTLNGLPLEQASAAEQLKLGVAVACAMNPSLKVMLIRDGSLLDDDSMAMIEQMAEAHQAQIWIERVGNDGKCTVVIEDGEVSPQTGAGTCQPPNGQMGKPVSGAAKATPVGRRTALIEAMQADGVAVAVAEPKKEECLY